MDYRRQINKNWTTILKNEQADNMSYTNVNWDFISMERIYNYTLTNKG